MTKKILSVVLAVIMVASTFVMGASAITYSPALTNGSVKIITAADKTTVEPGDVVSFTVAIDPADYTDLGSFGLAIAYNKAQLTPVGSTNTEFRTWENDCAASYGNPSAVVNFNFAAATQWAAYLTAEEKAYYDGGIMILGSSTSSANRWNPAAGEVFMSFKMTVSDTVSAGDEIWIGVHDAGFQKKNSYVTVGTTRLQPDVANGDHKYDTTQSMVKLTVAGATEASILQYSKAQIRFRGIGANGVGTYENEFDVRTIAKISQPDFLATFESEENAIKKITDAGFVYATTSNVEAFDVDTAKEVAEGGSAANYVKAPVTYMQHTGDGADYIFTCLITDIPDADKTDGVSCLAYVCYEGEYIYFDAAATVSYADLYNTYFKF